LKAFSDLLLLLPPGAAERREGLGAEIPPQSARRGGLSPLSN